MKEVRKPIAAKFSALALAVTCAAFVQPAQAAVSKALLDTLLKNGAITQKDYDDLIETIKDVEENQAFKEKRIDQDVAKANAYLQKNAEAGTVMKNGIGLQSADGRNSVQLIGRLHMDYRAYAPNYDASVATPNDPTTDQFDFRRARLGVRGQFEKDWKFEIQGTYGQADNGMSESSTIIDVASIDYVANPALSYRFGKFKMPFSLEQLTSSNNIDFMERSMANQNEGEYVPAKETGAMIFGSPVTGTSYGLALSRGRVNKSSTTDSNDFIGRGTINAAKTFFDRDDWVTHLGYGYSEGKIAPFSSSTVTPANVSQSARDESRMFNNFFVATDAVLPGSHRTRSDIEYAVAYGPFKAQGEFFKIGYTTTGDIDRAVKINYNEILWNITGESHNYNNSTGAFGTIKPNAKFTDKGGIGAWQFGIRYTNFDASDFNTAVGKTDQASAWTYGLNWYVNDYVRFMLNYVDTKFERPVGTGSAAVTGNRAVLLRTQVSF